MQRVGPVLGEVRQRVRLRQHPVYGRSRVYPDCRSSPLLRETLE